MFSHVVGENLCKPAWKTGRLCADVTPRCQSVAGPQDVLYKARTIFFQNWKFEVICRPATVVTFSHSNEPRCAITVGVDPRGTV